jgi:hypothetical protein
MTDLLCAFASTGCPGDLWEPVSQQGRSLILGQKRPHMGKPSFPKMLLTMLTNKAVGE